MKALFALLLLLLTAAPSYALEITAEISQSEVSEAMTAACLLLRGEIPCPRSLPVAFAAELPPGTFGLYARGNAVFISNHLWNPQWGVFGKAVLVHELVHYMIQKAGLSKKLTGCQNEGIAWAVYNRYVVAEGRPDLANENWQAGYPQCSARG